MREGSARRSPVPDPAARDGRVTRRRFLAGLGVLAGAGFAAPFAARGRDPRRVEVSRPMLGTWVRMVVVHPDAERASRAIGAAYAAIARVDAQMSIHRSDSQLAAVNRAAGKGAVAVDPEVVEVVARACDVAARSGGVYDPTVLPLMELWGFYRARETWPSDREIAAAAGRVGHAAVRADRAAGTVALARPGMGLDLGSIGKGWALDRAVDALRAHGVRSALVDVGGNVYGLGTPGDGAAGWSIGVAHPVTGAVERVFVLRDAAVATSGNTEQYRVIAGQRVGHLFDARRGRPADGHLLASVEAATGVESDALSTAAFLLGPSAFGAWPGARAVHFVG
uniref:FAD:protein FMN transferase n=1 Tax=Eiseniibacteriota bacterium TaxID=2212470 RepID=A0A832I2F2_UNCEI